MTSSRVSRKGVSAMGGQHRAWRRAPVQIHSPLTAPCALCLLSMSRPRLAYLYSRYPVVSQTFCDSEMLALEGMGFDLEVVSLNPPPDSFRHERLDRLRAEIHYPAPEDVL